MDENTNIDLDYNYSVSIIQKNNFFKIQIEKKRKNERNNKQYEK